MVSLENLQEFAGATQCKDNGIFGILAGIRSCESEEHTVKTLVSDRVNLKSILIYIIYVIGESF